MEIKLHSLGTPESLDLRSILEGMYRRAGEVRDVSFPDDNTIRISLEGSFDYEYEYGIHKMVRVSPRDEDGKRRSSHVMVEINGKIRETIVCTYDFVSMAAKNSLTNKSTTDLFYVLSGHPLEMKMNKVPVYDYV